MEDFRGPPAKIVAVLHSFVLVTMHGLRALRCSGTKSLVGKVCWKFIGVSRPCSSSLSRDVSVRSERKFLHSSGTCERSLRFHHS